MNDHDQETFSFARSAKSHGTSLKTDLISADLRAPMSDEEHPFFTVEHEAHKALGLEAAAKFIVIERTRLLDDRPSAIHRVFLDPSRFPPNFLGQHNFQTDSLIDVYGRYGYKLRSRDTVLTARGTNTYEINLLGQRYRSDTRRIVLDAEQRLYAEDPKTGIPFVLEFLKASYLDDWKYEIKNRRA